VNAELTQHGDEAQPLTLNFLRDLALRLSIRLRLSFIRSYRGFVIVLLPFLFVRRGASSGGCESTRTPFSALKTGFEKSGDYD
jgi:hypothetical protein